MKKTNIAKKHHFISQAEQSLNSDRRYLLEYEVIDRETFHIQKSEKGYQNIQMNLQFTNLYNFKIGNQINSNFEALFQKYESKIKQNITSLLNKKTQGDIKSEVLNIFATKMLNFIRNPFSVKKMLNTFPEVEYHQTLSETFIELIRQVEESNKPQSDYITEKLKISKIDYNQWLTKIFLLTNPMENGFTVFDYVIKEIFENPDFEISISVFYYNNNSCLLSDRGFSIPIPDSKHMCFNFNLTSNSFIRYFFGNINELSNGKISSELIQKYKMKKKNVKVYFFEDDFKELVRYNQNVVYQCFQNVYCNDETISGVKF